MVVAVDEDGGGGGTVEVDKVSVLFVDATV
jgi:hypothetical protein